MALANYMLCDACGRKNVYIGEDDAHDCLTFCDEKCVMTYAARRSQREPAPAPTPKSVSPSSTLGVGEPAADTRDDSEALRTVRETMATPGFKVIAHFNGCGDVDLWWYCGDDCLAEVTESPSLATAVEDAFAIVRADTRPAPV